MPDAPKHAAPGGVVSAQGVVKRYGRTVALAGLDAEIGTGTPKPSLRQAD